MSTLTVTRKGQLTLRRDFLSHLGIKPGDQVSIEKLPNGRLQVSAPQRTGHISDVYGMLQRPGQPTLTIDEINEAIADGWAGIR